MKIGLVILSLVLIINCNKRDLSTPSKKVIGHWIKTIKITYEQSEKLKEMDDYFKKNLGNEWKEELSLYKKPGIYKDHWYFGKTDLQTGEGGFKFRSNKGKNFEGFYKIIRADSTSNLIEIAIYQSILKTENEKIIFFIGDKGKYLLNFENGQHDTLYYVDRKTE